MLQAIRLDSAPPLSYLITHVFVVMLGASPAALRVAPAIIGALLIPIVAALTRRCAGDRAGIVAAFICALAPALVMSSRDARMYAMATTLVALSRRILIAMETRRGETHFWKRPRAAGPTCAILPSN